MTTIFTLQTDQPEYSNEDLLEDEQVSSAEPHQEDKQNNLIIGVRGAGFFSEFFMVLNWLVYCKKYGINPIVIWKSPCCYYQEEGYHGQTNAWDYYFKPLSDAVPQPDDRQVFYFCEEWGINSFDPAWVEEHRTFVKSLIDEYIEIQPWIAEKKEAFYNAHMKGKKIIGLHVRGTDKYTEIAPVSLKRYLNVVTALIKEYPHCKVLVATDQRSILKFFKRHLKKRVIYYHALRSDNNNPIHLASPRPARIGEDVLVEVLLLAECDFLIHAQSNVSAAVLFFNPDLPHIWLKPKAEKRSVHINKIAEEKCFFSYCSEFCK